MQIIFIPDELTPALNTVRQVPVEVAAALQLFVDQELTNDDRGFSKPKFLGIGHALFEHINGLFISVIEKHPTPAIDSAIAAKELAKQTIKDLKTQVLGHFDPSPDPGAAKPAFGSMVVGEEKI